MALKPYQCIAVSKTKKCKVCGKRLKLNLLAKYPEADLCYTDFIIKNQPHLAIKKLHLTKKPHLMIKLQNRLATKISKN